VNSIVIDYFGILILHEEKIYEEKSKRLKI